MLVGLGGFLGSGLRYVLSSWAQRTLVLGGFPIGTLTVNVLGCLLIGYLGGLAEQRQFMESGVRLFLLVGVLGGFTTFSTFSLEMFTMLNQGRWMLAIGYSVSSVVLCVLVTWLGLRAGQMMQ